MTTECDTERSRSLTSDGTAGVKLNEPSSSLAEGATDSQATGVWAQVLRRFEVRVKAYGEGMRRTAEKRVAQGGEGLNERELARHVERIGPCAIPTEGGSWSWEARMATLMSTV